MFDSCGMCNGEDRACRKDAAKVLAPSANHDPCSGHIAGLSISRNATNMQKLLSR